MGCFDSLYVECPKCNKDIEFQTKMGGCSLQEFTLDTIPPEMLVHFKDDTEVCEECGTEVKVDVQIIAIGQVKKV